MPKRAYNEADVWMINQVKQLLIQDYSLDEQTAKQYMADFQFEDYWICQEPYFVQHEGPEVFAEAIVNRQRNLRHIH